MSKKLIKNALIVTAEKAQSGEVLIDGQKIAAVHYYEATASEGTEVETSAAEEIVPDADTEVIDLKGLTLMAGGIDAHVHFRDPGMTRKADIASESQAALLGGITSFMDMPNTHPTTTTWEHLTEKLDHAAQTSAINYGFHFGATNQNAEAINALIAEGKGRQFGAVKVFMGSSTGNMLVDDNHTLDQLFSIQSKRVFIHSEDEHTIRQNLTAAKEKYGDQIPFNLHPEIRSRQACILSTIKALETAMKLGTRLHVCHVSTAEEVQMIRAAKMHQPEISAETSSNYLWFCDEDYETMGAAVKCNPAIKTAHDREALIQGIKDGIIDTIGSDHAPHLPEEKARPYTTCPSGLPSIGQSFPAVLTIAAKHEIPLTRVAAIMSENIAKLLGIEGRGKIEVGNYADLVVIDPKESYTLTKEEVAYKCGWSPYEGKEFTGRIHQVWVNGTLAVKEGKMIQKPEAMPLIFND